jgi:thioredoxin 1
MLQAFDRTSFESTVEQGRGVVVVDYWAPWCRYCPPMQATVERVAERNPAITFGKVNTDEQYDLTERARIHSLPTVVIYRDGQEVSRLEGVQPPAALQRVLDRLS